MPKIRYNQRVNREEVFVTDAVKQTLLNNLFHSLADLKIRTVDEYNNIIGNALETIADEFGIAKVAYTIEPPEEELLDFKLPKKGLLFEHPSKACGSPFAFRHPFAMTGAISFEVYPVAGSTVVTECEEDLSEVFQLFYYILNTTLFEFLYARLASYDLLTGMPVLSAFLQFCTEQKEQGTLCEYTALNFNIRNFKSVHNSLSYLEGNKLLKTYSHILSKAVTKREFIAHIGGDNFVAMILNENLDYFLDLIGNMVVKYPKDDTTLTFSFGAIVGALTLGNEDDPDEIMMHISAAYQAAREKRTLLCYYDKKSELDLLEQKKILSKFSQGLLAREFRVVYQPKVSIKDRTLCGAEALVRWFLPDGGMIMPGSFIPVLEKDGCICALDFYVLEEVCRFQQKLMYAGITPVKISVNFSKRHLSNNKLVEEIFEIVDMYDVPHKYIEVELTESEAFRNSSIIKDIVDELCMKGITTSIDDFGTGYSSLGMLRTLALDTLKIDRSFIPVTQNEESEKSKLILNSVVNLAKSLGFSTVAEGVETPEQLEILEKMDCDIIQGYIFDKPLPEEEFVERLKQHVYNMSTR